MAKPFVKWAGGKLQLINIIDEKIGDLRQNSKEFIYVEPFVGGGSVLFHLLETCSNMKYAVINDANEQLMNVYKVIADDQKYLEFKEYVESKGYKVFPMSAPINIGVKEVLAEAADKLQKLLEEPQEDDGYEMFDFEADEYDPDYRTVSVEFDGRNYILSGKQLEKIFNSTNFTDSGSVRYLYRYIEKSGALDKMKELGIEDGDTIKIKDFELEYLDEEYLDQF